MGYGPCGGGGWRGRKAGGDRRGGGRRPTGAAEDWRGTGSMGPGPGRRRSAGNWRDRPGPTGVRGAGPGRRGRSGPAGAVRPAEKVWLNADAGAMVVHGPRIWGGARYAD